MPALLKRFCELKNVDPKEVIGTWQGSEAVQLKKLFIATFLKLYNPDLLTGIHTDAMRQNLREELSRCLKCNSTWISQWVTNIKTFLDPYRPHKKAFEDFKKELNDIAEILANEFKQQ